MLLRYITAEIWGQTWIDRTYNLLYFWTRKFRSIVRAVSQQRECSLNKSDLTLSLPEFWMGSSRYEAKRFCHPQANSEGGTRSRGRHPPYDNRYSRNSPNLLFFRVLDQADEELSEKLGTSCSNLSFLSWVIFNPPQLHLLCIFHLQSKP